MSEAFYRSQQQRMHSSSAFRKFWVFWGLYSIFLLTPLALLLFSAAGRAQLLLAMAAFGLSRGVLSNVVTRLYHKTRPYQRYQFEPRTSRWFSQRTMKPNSFPSKHVASFAAIAMLMLFYSPIIGAAIFLIGIMAGWARVVIGYHYPVDVVAGLIIGIIAGIIIYFVGHPLLFTGAV